MQKEWGENLDEQTRLQNAMSQVAAMVPPKSKMELLVEQSLLVLLYEHFGFSRDFNPGSSYNDGYTYRFLALKKTVMNLLALQKEGSAQ